MQRLFRLFKKLRTKIHSSLSLRMGSKGDFITLYITHETHLRRLILRDSDGQGMSYTILRIIAVLKKCQQL